MAASSLDGVRSPYGSGPRQVEGRWAGLAPGKRKEMGIPGLWALGHLVGPRCWGKGNTVRMGRVAERNQLRI